MFAELNKYQNLHQNLKIAPYGTNLNALSAKKLSLFVVYFLFKRDVAETFIHILDLNQGPFCCSTNCSSATEKRCKPQKLKQKKLPPQQSDRLVKSYRRWWDYSSKQDVVKIRSHKCPSIFSPHRKPAFLWLICDKWRFWSLQRDGKTAKERAFITSWGFTGDLHTPQRVDFSTEKCADLH